MTNLMLSMNQFEQLIGLTRDHMRDSLFVYKATSSTGDTCHFGIESAAKAWAKGGTVEAIKVREFKLHTSSPTAAPVGERELPPLPSYARWEERIKMLMQQCGHPNSMSIYQAFKQFQNEFEHEMIAYARAALSAGDAGWQPIETAPKDGSDCWLLVEEEVRRGFWVEIEFEERRDLDGRYIDQTDDYAYWMDKDSGDSLEPTMFYPITKPLPPAPAMRKGQL